MCLVVTKDEQQNRRVRGAQSGPLPSTEMHYKELHLLLGLFPSLTCLMCFVKGLLALYLVNAL